jgi:hypothetical protein
MKVLMACLRKIREKRQEEVDWWKYMRVTVTVMPWSLTVTMADTSCYFLNVMQSQRSPPLWHIRQRHEGIGEDYDAF